jgi:hypothetical protein
MPNAEVLKDECEYVAKLQLRNVAVLNYLGPETNQDNIDRVKQARMGRGPDGTHPSRARVVIGESQQIAVKHGSIYANLESVRHIGRLTREHKVGECDQFACAIMESLLISRTVQQQKPKIEILGTGRHAFVVVNRRDDAEDNNIDTWQDAILVDVWTFNQGASAEPVWWATQSESLRKWAALKRIQRLFLFRATDWPGG